jgi:hypothetical protein
MESMPPIPAVEVDYTAAAMRERDTRSLRLTIRGLCFACGLAACAASSAKGPITSPTTTEITHCASNEPPFAAIERLATTTEPVRVLVYGQSISEQSWWSKTKAWLERTYPNGRLIMENHAHGGCSSQCLIGHEPFSLDGSQRNRLPEDVFAFKPDLIIFHVYGDHVDYGYIMKAFREGCAAFDDYRTWDGKDVPQVHCSPEQQAQSVDFRPPEVLVQNDWIPAREPPACSPEPSATAEDWSCYMNVRVIPEQIARYGYRLQDNFRGWPAYIKSHDLDPPTLLAPDGNHLGDPLGTDVMAALTIPHLCNVRVAPASRPPAPGPGG